MKAPQRPQVNVQIVPPNALATASVATKRTKQKASKLPAAILGLLLAAGGAIYSQWDTIRPLLEQAQSKLSGAASSAASTVTPSEPAPAPVDPVVPPGLGPDVVVGETPLDSSPGAL